MNVRSLVCIAIVFAACGCSSIKKMTTQATQVELTSSKSQDTPEYWQQEWKLRATSPVAIKLVSAGKSMAMVPNATEGEVRYTVTMRLGRSGGKVYGLVALVEGSDPKKGGKTASGQFVIGDFPKGSLRGGTHPITTVEPGKVPFTLDLLKVGTDPKPVVTMTFVGRDEVSQFRNEAR